MSKNIPNHIAFIVDGNRRWAKNKGLGAVAGHKKVAEEVIDRIVFRCLEKGVKYATFWAFSTENWKRGDEFANMLWKILRKLFEREIGTYNEKGIRLNTIGDLSKLPKDIQEMIKKRKEESKHLDKLVVTVALNYGGRDEMVRAMKKMIKEENINPETAGSISEEMFEKYLDTKGMPDVDLIIRTGGEQRTSGYLPWQSTYAEFYYTETLFPDFNEKELDKAIEVYGNRDRRFGGQSNKS